MKYLKNYYEQTRTKSGFPKFNTTGISDEQPVAKQNPTTIYDTLQGALLVGFVLVFVGTIIYITLYK